MRGRFDPMNTRCAHGLGRLPFLRGGWAEDVGAQVVAGDGAGRGFLDGDAPFAWNRTPPLSPLRNKGRMDADGGSERCLRASRLDCLEDRLLVHSATIAPLWIAVNSFARRIASAE